MDKKQWYKNKIDLPKETIYEIITADDNTGFGIALADIKKSDPHFHRKTVEVYTLISGKLVVHLGDHKVVLLSRGDTVTIPPCTIHWAEGDGRILVETIPAWIFEDHVLIHSTKGEDG